MKERLLASASALIQPPASAAAEFAAQSQQLAEMGNRAIAGREDFDKLVGRGNQAMAEDNNRNFARFMTSLFKDFSPEVLVETVLWVFRAYRSHGFQSTYWAVNLNIWADMIQRELSEESQAAIAPYYDWLIINIPIFTKLSDDTLAKGAGGSEPEH